MHVGRMNGGGVWKLGAVIASYTHLREVMRGYNELCPLAEGYVRRNEKTRSI